MNKAHKSEAELKSEIIDILDPARLSSDLTNKSLEELRGILDKRTNSVRRITHDSYQEIYDMDSPGYSRSNEVVILKNRVMKQNVIIDELRNIVKQKEDELVLLKTEYEKLKRTKSFKSEIHEEGSFASYIASKEAEDEGDILPTITTQTLLQQSQKVRPYMAYTPNKRFLEPSTFINPPSTLYNGNINEQEAIQMAIKQSEIDATRAIDAPFERTSGSSDPFESMDAEEPESQTQKERDYSHLLNRPTSLTDEMLNDFVDLLIIRDFDKVKTSLLEWPAEVSRYVRLLTYKEESFKQMMVSKSINIHKCIIGEL